MLHRLVSATRREVDHTVVSLTDEGIFGPRLRSNGVPVASLGMRRVIRAPVGAVRLAVLLRRERPDLVHAWMYHANLVAGTAAALARTPVVWGIRRTSVAGTKAVTRWTSALCARLSATIPARIVCCAESAMSSHAALGYRADRMVVISNGFDLAQFAPDPDARARVRAELSIGDSAPVVGLVARFHPDKDHLNFLDAAARVARAIPDVVLVMAGHGVVPENSVLASWIDGRGLRDRVRLLAVRSDVARVLAALDVLASSSRTEGFSQVLGEAMACGVPCAATDCGDSREVVGPTGRVVPPGDPAALVDAVSGLLEDEERRVALGTTARALALERYSWDAIAQRLVQVYELVTGSRAGSAVRA
jgi:glycosyltransferase involved in cell wall biosynthesis